MLQIPEALNPICAVQALEGQAQARCLTELHQQAQKYNAQLQEYNGKLQGDLKASSDAAAGLLVEKNALSQSHAELKGSLSALEVQSRVGQVRRTLCFVVS